MDYPNDFPTKNKKRGERRFKFFNICHRLEDRILNVHRGGNWLTKDELHILSKKLAITPSPCNCWRCRNPRRVFKGFDALPIQEKKAPKE